MTGRYPLRYGLQTGVIPPGAAYGLPFDEFVLPQMLKDAGYGTAMVGKWHLGHADTAFWPMQRGFDSFYGALVGEIDHFEHDRRKTVNLGRDDVLLLQTARRLGQDLVVVLADVDREALEFHFL